MIADIERLVRCESPSDDLAAVARSAEVVAALGTRLLGAEPELLVSSGRTHLRWRFGASRRVLVLGHHDTVWPHGSLATHPFEVRDGVLRGPGCFDMKAGVVMAMHALAALPDRDGVTLLVTGDEELGSPSSRSLIETEARGCAAALVLEASADGGALKTERKGVSLYEVAVEGRAAHAGLEPERGVNATIEAAHQVLAVAELGDAAAGTTVTPTRIEAGTTSNTVAAGGRFAVDVRVRGGAEQDRVDAAMRALAPRLAGARVRVTGGPNRPPLAAEASAALYARAAAVADRLGVGPLRRAAVGGASDGNFTAGVGTPTLDGLGAVGGGAHAADEHVRLDQLPRRTALVRELVADLLREEGTDEPSRPTRPPARELLCSGHRYAPPSGALRCAARRTPNRWVPRRRADSRTAPDGDPMRAATDLATAARLGGGATAGAPSRPAPAGDDEVAAAIAAAESAARSAGVYIRALDGMPELHRMCELYERIWRFGGERMPISVELVRAMSKAGNYIAGAFDGDELVGACVGFFAPPAHRSLHSHIAGVSPQARGRSIGFALKVHQRAWALRQGITEIAWTYDPLVGRNAYFNIGKLGARPVEYLANFYGPMHDGLNGADETDRLLIEWRLADPRVVAACGGSAAGYDAAGEEAAGARYALRSSPSGDPLRTPTEPEPGQLPARTDSASGASLRTPTGPASAGPASAGSASAGSASAGSAAGAVRPVPAGAGTVLVAVPPDIEGLRASDPACAARWRAAVRAVLGELLASGGRIRGFDRGDCYIVDTGGQA